VLLALFFRVLFVISEPTNQPTNQPTNHKQAIGCRLSRHVLFSSLYGEFVKSNHWSIIFSGSYFLKQGFKAAPAMAMRHNPTLNSP
jgi:hypothetical protein